MKIIILGAGQVGGSLAEHLAREEKNDITIIDSDRLRIRELQDRLDIRTICGHASLPSNLRMAGAHDADMLIAVTNSDEVNMVACQIASKLFHTPKKIARIRQTDYLKDSTLFQESGIMIDVFISPEDLVMKNLKRLIEHPGSLQVLDFASGKVQLIAVRAYYGSPMVGKELQIINEHMSTLPTKIVAIFRKNDSVPINQNTVIEADDEVFFMADGRNVKRIMKEFRSIDQPYKHLFIAGGGNIGFSLAHALEAKYSVKIIESNVERCQFLSEHLNKAIILNGNASDRDLLVAESVHNADIYIALTNDDEANVMSSMLAKRLGVKRVISLINNPAYVDLVQGGEIDVAISPQLITTSNLLRHVRRGDVVNVHSLRRGAAEAIEAVAHGDERSSQVVGLKLSELHLPVGASIGAIIRDNKVLIATEDIQIVTDDHIIIFLTDKKKTREVEKLFQVGLAFF